jgi:hypothetical protein
VEKYVNRQLNRAHDYAGRVGNIHLQLWRGRYRIDNIRILKRSGSVPVPFFSAHELSLAIEWSELFHGSIVGQVIMNEPRLNFVSGPTEAQSQSGQDEGWSSMLESLFPFDLNRVEITNGEVHFQNQYSTPPVDLYLHGLSATATNLNNSRNVQGELPAGAMAKATTIGGGGLDLNVHLNPMAKAPTYQVDAQLTNVDLTALNSFLRAYGKFDVASGQFALFTSVASKDGNYDGYLKVFFNKLNVFAWEKERKKNILEIFWQAVVGTLTTAFKNHSTDSLATRVPISGSYAAGSDVGVMSAVGSLLRNAFIRALVPKIDQQVTLTDAQQKAQAKKKLSEPIQANKGAEKLSTTQGH